MEVTAATIPEFSPVEINGENPTDLNGIGLFPIVPVFSTTFPTKMFWATTLKNQTNISGQPNDTVYSYRE